MLAPFSEENQEKVQKGIKDTVKAVLGTLEVGIDKRDESVLILSVVHSDK